MHDLMEMDLDSLVGQDLTPQELQLLQDAVERELGNVAGDVQIVGGTDIIGAAGGNAMQRLKKLRAQIVARKQLARPMAVERSELGPVYTGYVGLSQGVAESVAPGGSFEVMTQVQAPFTPKRFIIDPSILDDFEITNLRIGTKNLVAGRGNGFPAAMFAPDSRGSVIQTLTGQTATEFAVTGRNRSAAARRFVSGFDGLFQQ